MIMRFKYRYLQDIFLRKKAQPPLAVIPSCPIKPRKSVAVLSSVDIETVLSMPQHIPLKAVTCTFPIIPLDHVTGFGDIRLS